PEDKKRFEEDVQQFLGAVKVIGIDTKVETLDRILVASSAVIPLFGFPGWTYTKLNEVLLYPRQFDRDFRTEGEDRRILGMVGDGYMSRTMVLSRPALHQSFSSKSSKSHLGIHEFVHLLDKADGSTDGVPEIFLDNEFIHPWAEFIRKKIEEMRDQGSDIDGYGATSPSEFFPVVAEYFFKRPQLLEKKHPKLYQQMEKIFRQDLTDS
ncbi:MAG TPA: M90 family metallopeptidase, partial [Saprospiraceae bacterium]|nr:M90 family metallopeptidase [Saprospiraceae bacterium]